MRRQIFGGWMVLVVVVSMISLGSHGPVTSQDKVSMDGSIGITMQGSANAYATVTVFRDGKAVATKDVIINAGVTEFKNLLLGAYEVRLECPGWKTLVRRAILTATDKRADLKPEMVKGDGTLIVGPGPSMEDLEVRIEKLEAAVTKIQGK